MSASSTTPEVQIAVGPPIVKVLWGTRVEATLYENGIEAKFFFSETHKAASFLAWDRVKRVRRLVWGNPFVRWTGENARRMSGTYIEGPDGEFVLLDALDQDYDAAWAIVQDRLQARWATVFDPNELVSTGERGTSTLEDPPRVRPVIAFLPDPRLVAPGKPISREPHESFAQRKRKEARGALGLALFAAGGIALGVWLLGIQFWGPGLPWILAVMSLLIGGTSAVFVPILLVRWLRVGEIELHENGVMLPAEYSRRPERFIPFSLQGTGAFEARWTRGRTVTIATLPWVLPVDLSVEFPMLLATLKAAGVPLSDKEPPLAKESPYGEP